MKSLLATFTVLTLWSATHRVTEGLPLSPYEKDFHATHPSEHQTIERDVARGGSEFIGQVAEEDASAPSEIHRDRFGSQRFGTRQSRNERPASDEPHRSAYMTTRFSPVISLFDHSGIGEKTRTQLWSPVEDFQTFDMAQARSFNRHLQDSPDLLGSGALVGVDERVIDVIEAYPVDCSQQVLCKVGRNLIEASPWQALFLYNFEGNVFGYRDEGSQRAIRAALAGDDCESLFKGCPDSFS